MSLSPINKFWGERRKSTPLSLSISVAFGVLLIGCSQRACKNTFKLPKEANQAHLSDYRAAHADLYGDLLPPGAVARMGSMRFRHQGKINCIVFSPDGKTIASTGGDRWIRLWEVTTGKPLRQWQLKWPVRQLMFSPNGKTLAAHWSGMLVISLWEVRTGKEFVQLTAQGGQFQATGNVSLVISDDGQFLACSAYDRICRVWEMASGKLIRTFGESIDSDSSLAFSADGKNLMCILNDMTFSVWEIASGKQVRTLKVGRADFNAANKATPQSVALSSDGQVLAIGHGDGTIQLVDMLLGKSFKKMTCPYPVHRMIFSSNLKYLASYSDLHGASCLRVWTVLTGLLSFEISSNLLGEAAALSNDGKTLAVAAHPNSIRLWDVPSQQERPSPQTHNGAVRWVGFSPDGKILATQSSDRSMILWEPLTGKQVVRMPLDRDPWFAWCPAFFSADSRRVACLRDSRTLCFWEVPNGKESRRVTWDNTVIRSLGFSSNTNIVAVEVEPGPILLCLVGTSKPLATIPSPKTSGHVVLSGGPGLTFSVDGRLLASTNHATTIYIWDTATRKELHRLNGHQGRINSLAFSPTNKYIVSGAGEHEPHGHPWDSTIRVWDVASGRQLFIGRPHQGEINCVAYSTDGRTFASASADTMACLWEAASGRKLIQFQDPMNMVNALAYSPDGLALATGMADGTTLICDLTPPSWQKALENQQDSNWLNRLWADLADDDAPQAYRAVWSLSSVPEKSVPFLKARLRPVTGEKPERIHQLIADLDNDDFYIRQTASRELARIGQLAEPLLRKALAHPSSVEAHSRIEILLKALDEWLVKDPETLRSIRAIWVLQRIGSDDARALLQKLAQGAPAARFTEEAQAAFQILQKQHSEK